MTEIEIPFRADMAKAILEGRKSCTSRTKQYGEPGDTFQVQGMRLQLLRIEQHVLAYVSSYLYGAEGTNSPQEFEELWAEIHPRRGFIEDEAVFTHFFEPVDELERKYGDIEVI